MNADFQPSDELAELLVELTEGRLDARQGKRLNELLQQEPAARDCYVEYVSLHAMLDWHHGSVPVLELPLDPSDDRMLPARSTSSRWAGLAVAAALFIAATLAVVFMPDRVPHAEKSKPLAILLETENIVWDQPDGQPESDSLRAGKQRIAAGVARIRLTNGVIVALRGPVEFELLSGNRFAIERGVMRAYAPPSAKGFTVQAPGVDVVDLGTEFGVSVSAFDDVQVHVFRGAVRVNMQLDIRANEALYIDHKANVKNVKLESKNFPSIGR